MVTVPSITHDGVQYLEADPDWLRGRGVPENVILSALDDLRAAQVSAECRRRIYAEASAEAQANMSLAAGILGAKDAGTRSASETAILSAAGTALQWVAEMRAAYRAIAADPAADYLDDAAWPPLDEAVRSMIKENF